MSGRKMYKSLIYIQFSKNCSEYVSYPFTPTDILVHHYNYAITVTLTYQSVILCRNSKRCSLIIVSVLSICYLYVPSNEPSVLYGEIKHYYHLEQFQILAIGMLKSHESVTLRHIQLCYCRLQNSQEYFSCMLDVVCWSHRY
jgi:hypothetical protein